VVLLFIDGFLSMAFYSLLGEAIVDESLPLGLSCVGKKNRWN
jgi:hypothetical protein